MLRNLIQHRRINLAVLLGAAVATAVLTGALLVGDSVRASLRRLTLERLGGIDAALVTPGFFRAALADELAAAPGFSGEFRAVAPAIVLRGGAVHGGTGARASRVGIQGIDERFVALFGAPGAWSFERAPGQLFPSVILNATLQRELGATVGDAILLSFGRHSEIPRDTLMGEKQPGDVVGTLRLSVSAVVPDAGLGGFGLTPSQESPRNAFIALQQAQRALDVDGQVNALFLGQARTLADPAARGNALLASRLGLEELGLRLEPRDDFLMLHSREFVLRPDVDRALGQAAEAVGAPLQRVQSYLANTLRHGERTLPYSMVSAVDALPRYAWAALRTPQGEVAPVLPADGILLNRWAAEDLGVSVGDALPMTYFVVGPREELAVEEHTFRVEGIVAMTGLAGDRSLTPDYPGIQEAADMAAWDPPFPVDLSLIRARDEAYWDEYGATPKAFVAEATGRELWSTRFGSTTAARLGAAPGRSLDETAAALRAELLRRLSGDAFGFEFRAVKQQGLAASAGATDFSGLFIGFSLFLIVSAALLVGLLFSLGVERRAPEIGLLRAVGYPLGRVRRGLLAEGAVLAALGGLLGLAGAVGYAAAMMAGLRTLWLAAVGSSRLFLAVQPLSLALGWVLSLLVVLGAIQLALRRLQRVPPPALLAGTLRPALERRRRGRLARLVGWSCIALALALLGGATLRGATSSPAVAFGAGTLLLIGGLASFSAWCRGSERRRAGRLPSGTLLALAARNSAWNPGRSILCVALVASACFVIVALAANRGAAGAGRPAGTGGYALVAESEIPVHQDLSAAEDLHDLAFTSAEAASLATVRIEQFRRLPGDDASCLNLYRPERPTLLGLPTSFIERGGFAFKSHVALPAGVTDPWRLLEQPLEPGVIPAIGDANSMQWILKLGLGQELEIEDELGRPLKLRLVATLATSIFQSELLIGEPAFLEHFPGRSGYGYFLIDAPAEREEPIARLLEARLADFGLDSTTTGARLAAYQIVEHTYISTFQLLGALGLLLGTVGLGVVLVRNVIERRGELATLRAFGFPRRRLARLVLAENAFLLFVGIAIGAGSALLAVAPRLLEIHVPWLSLLVTLAAVALVGMLASLVAVRGALRIPLLAALKAER